MTLTEGQVSDCKGATLLIDALPEAEKLLADRGSDVDWCRDALQRYYALRPSQKESKETHLLR